MSRPAWATSLFGCLLVLSLVVVVQRFFLDADDPAALAVTPRSRIKLEDIPFDGEQAYTYLKEICDLGPRVTGSEPMAKQQELLIKHFTELGGQVALQKFRGRNPVNGSLTEMANLIVQWHPEKKERVLFAAHYDTRPIPDRDPDVRNRRQGVFVGANDGASGVALLMEMGRAMPKLDGPVGVDFVFLDAEEFVFDNDRDPYFLGSEWFARQYVSDPPDYTYRWGVLVDMIADSDLQIWQEKNSLIWSDTRPLVHDIWKTAERLKVKEFIPRAKHQVNDDHIKLRNVGKIPTCDIIDFDYPHWHTARDTANKCSALSLAKVGWVLEEWLKSIEK